ncbi:MAG: ABC transporter substrate-binding protein [Nocardioides sp.]
MRSKPRPARRGAASGLPVLRVVALSAVAALVLTACGNSSTSNDGGGGPGATFVFGASADPVILDGAYVSDGESLRALRQIFEGLVNTKPGTTEIIPWLAESWTTSEDGLTWTFALKSGVKFHDDTDFNADAVCFNFDRWYNFTGLQQSASVSYYWQTVFGGYAASEDESLPDSLYRSCEAADDATAVITLSRPSSTFLSALSLGSFAIASPTALEKYGADEVGGSADAPTFSGTFGTEHPVGTGPFEFKSWAREDSLILTAFGDYWGEPSTIDNLVFRPIADGPARRQALEAGDIDGYDLVDPADLDALAEGGYDVLQRPAFNVGYIGFNQAIAPMDNPKIRQAIAHAINREKVISTNYPTGSEVATQFQPPEVFGHSDSVPTYDYDPAKAEQLIAESGVANPTLEFWYPSDVSRPYMPDPAANYQLMKADLEAVGFTVQTKSAPWDPDYLDKVDAGKAMMYLLGWTGDFGDPDNFIGTFFQTKIPPFGFSNPEIFGLLDKAEAETDLAKRTELYVQANDKIMEFLPGLPYVHTEPSLAFIPGVTGYVPSPIGNEDFNVVSLPSS